MWCALREQRGREWKDHCHFQKWLRRYILNYDTAEHPQMFTYFWYYILRKLHVTWSDSSQQVSPLTCCWANGWGIMVYLLFFVFKLSYTFYCFILARSLSLIQGLSSLSPPGRRPGRLCFALRPSVRYQLISGTVNPLNAKLCTPLCTPLYTGIVLLYYFLHFYTFLYT